MTDYLSYLYDYNTHPLVHKHLLDYKLHDIHMRISGKWQCLTTKEKRLILDVYDQMINYDHISLSYYDQTVLLNDLVDIVFKFALQELILKKEVEQEPVEESVKEVKRDPVVEEPVKREPAVEEPVEEPVKEEIKQEKEVFVFSDKGLLILDDISGIVASADNTCKQKIKLAILKLDNILDEIDAIDKAVMSSQEKKQLICKISEKLAKLEVDDKSLSVLDNMNSQTDNSSDEIDCMMDEMLKIINSVNTTSSLADMYDALQDLLSLINKLGEFSSEKDNLMEHIMKSYKTIVSLIEIRKEKEELEERLTHA